MNLPSALRPCGCFFLLLAAPAAALIGKAPSRPPNIVIILSDDQGYADIGSSPHRSPEVETPHLDALAREGVLFRQAYTSGNVCAPTRAGLLTGRYQQRAGVYNAAEGTAGMPLTTRILPHHLQPRGYVTAALGKWHLGMGPEKGPAARGFDESYVFLGRGAHDYFKLDQKAGDGGQPLYRNGRPIADRGYLTTRITEEAEGFIRRHRARPFALYLAYNAVHAPPQAPQADIERLRRRFPALPQSRVVLAAMLHHLDLGVGRVVATLKREGLWENTLLFFLTDNGGAKGMSANNAPLRDFKTSHYEGGIRTPLIVSWPARFEGGRAIDTPVISLDLLPTILDAAGIALPDGDPLDGKSLLPLLAGKQLQHHDTLFWSEGGKLGGWAVREGDWKLVGTPTRTELFNLAKDVSETTNLAGEFPAIVATLTARHATWLDALPPPLSGQPKRHRTSSNSNPRDERSPSN